MITKIGQKIGLKPVDLILYGDNKAKIKKTNFTNKMGKLILVTAITPTPAGEGKTTVSIGLADGLNHINEKAVLALREPSLGPVFGLKGGAIGGGKSSLTPANDINLHFTGDFHAITAANNLLASLIDNHIYFGNELNIETVVFKRALDINDRELRKINTNLRIDGFNITAASEIMAIMTFATSIEDLKDRINKILIGYDKNSNPVYAKQLNCTDAVVSLLVGALQPNLVQTTEGTPAIIHLGPFANVATGCNSNVATTLALKLGDYAITEAGFASDLGMEKFLNIMSRQLPKKPDLIVIVATIKALKYHGGVDLENLNTLNNDALIKGTANLLHHIEHIKTFGLKPLVVLNQFPTDQTSEIDVLSNWCIQHNIEFTRCKAFIDGSSGAVEFAKKVISLCAETNNFVYHYELNDNFEDKMLKIAQKAYGAKTVSYSQKAKSIIDILKQNKWDKLPICVAKTHLSISGDANIKNRPQNFNIHISDIKPSLGAGFIVCLTKGIVTMPGLNKTPRANKIIVSKQGEIFL